VLQESLVENVAKHPLAAATVLRSHGLEGIFVAMTATMQHPERTAAPPSAASNSEELREFRPEDLTLEYIIGMEHHPRIDTDRLPPWCKCGRCRVVQNKKARVCCRKTTGDCVLLTDQELRLFVLGGRFVRASMNQERCLRHQSSWDDNSANLRFQAYQQFTFATIGHTGRGNRVPLPACVCWAIRDRSVAKYK
jgi:hypothetical protein